MEEPPDLKQYVQIAQMAEFEADIARLLEEVDELVNPVPDFFERVEQQMSEFDLRDDAMGRLLQYWQAVGYDADVAEAESEGGRPPARKGIPGRAAAYQRYRSAILDLAGVSYLEIKTQQAEGNRVPVRVVIRLARYLGQLEGLGLRDGFLQFKESLSKKRSISARAPSMERITNLFDRILQVSRGRTFATVHALAKAMSSDAKLRELWTAEFTDPREVALIDKLESSLEGWLTKFANDTHHGAFRRIVKSYAPSDKRAPAQKGGKTKRPASGTRAGRQD